MCRSGFAHPGKANLANYSNKNVLPEEKGNFLGIGLLKVKAAI